MPKIRVYELANELGLDNKEILAKLRQLKVQVKSHMSVIPEEDLEKVRKALSETDTTTSVSGREEKRVAQGVIRRRPKAAAPPPPAEPPKVDLQTLKTTAKRPRRPEEESPAKPEPEMVDGLPKEWQEEEVVRPQKKAVRKKSASRAAGLPEKTPPPKTAAEEEKATAPEPPSSPEAELAPPPTVPGPWAETTPAPAEQPPAAEIVDISAARPKPPVAVKRKIYMRPVIRKTARAPEGEPLPLPGAPQPPPPAEVVPLTEEELARKKKKKKKKGREEEALAPEVFEEGPPKKKLRRKIAFKVQRGMEGMELADIEQMYLPSRKKITGKKKVVKKTMITTPKAAKRIIRMGAAITVLELARQLEVKTQEVIKALMAEGVAATEDQNLDADTAGIIANTYNYEVVQEVFDESKILSSPPPEPSRLQSRPPVVTVMGHVDHGKTSLLDTIRKTRVTEEEAGQITQHIGAYLVETSSGRIVFVDTPGHEAFTTMRARGAKITDIVVLVVAADDGIMAQTVEAANHAKAAQVPIIVALNKIDLPTANPGVVRQRLSELGLTPEEWGGDTLVVECSAKTGQGIPELLEAILLQAEMLELSADPHLPGKGFVIESFLDKGKGPVVTVIIQEGTLRRGHSILCGIHSGRIRAMLDDRGRPVGEAGPSMPVEVMGLSGVPEPGAELIAVEDEKKLKLVLEHRLAEQKAKAAAVGPAKVSLEDLMARLEEGEVQSLNLVLKTDTHGSAEAIVAAVEKLSSKEVRPQFLHSGVGNITENDVLLASASNAVILGFMVKVEASARKLAEEEGVQIRSYEIIYELIDDVQASLKGLLKPVFREEVIGKAEVRKVFRVSKVGAVAGCYVTEGVIRRSARARILRNQEILHTGRFKSIKRLQDDVKEVNQGLECGIALENWNDFQEGDLIEAYEVSETSPG